MIKKEKATGWKCFDSDLYCRGFKFEIGKSYKVDGELEMCQNGFHFHENPQDIFNYYPKESRICEIEAFDVITDLDKSICRKIVIVRELKGIEKRLLGYGSGSGYGYGDGDGYGYGSGDGDGYGYGYVYGDGSGSGDGSG